MPRSVIRKELEMGRERKRADVYGARMELLEKCGETGGAACTRVRGQRRTRRNDLYLVK